MEIKSIIKHLLHYNIILAVLFAVVSCASYDKKAQDIVDNCIEVHGGKNYDDVLIQFTFRDRKYSARKDDGKFTYSREFKDSLGMVKDILDNDGFQRFIDDKLVPLDEEMKSRYSNSVNGVIYFALLPQPLNDPAVRKEFIGKTTIKGVPYNKIRVTFSEKGGGEDHSDTYIYWIHEVNNTMDYLAYEYETDGGGSRFREAKNPRRVHGILFLDYNNFKPTEKHPLEEYDILFEEGKLEDVSNIELDDIKVMYF